MSLTLYIDSRRGVLISPSYIRKLPIVPIEPATTKVPVNLVKTNKTLPFHRSSDANNTTFSGLITI